MKSFMASPSNIERKWYVVDATGHTLGRLSSEIASILRGKNKGMLPKGPLGRQMIKKLYVYAGPEHKQQAQKPEVLEIKY